MNIVLVDISICSIFSKVSLLSELVPVKTSIPLLKFSYIIVPSATFLDCSCACNISWLFKFKSAFLYNSGFSFIFSKKEIGSFESLTIENVSIILNFSSNLIFLVNGSPAYLLFIYSADSLYACPDSIKPGIVPIFETKPESQSLSTLSAFNSIAFLEDWIVAKFNWERFAFSFEDTALWTNLFSLERFSLIKLFITCDPSLLNPSAASLGKGLFLYLSYTSYNFGNALFW